MLLGPERAGKTNLVGHAVGKNFQEKYIETEGIETKITVVDLSKDNVDTNWTENTLSLSALAHRDFVRAVIEGLAKESEESAQEKPEIYSLPQGASASNMESSDSEKESLPIVSQEARREVSPLPGEMPTPLPKKHFPQNSKSTFKADVSAEHLKVVRDIEVFERMSQSELFCNIQLWDFAGQEDYYAIHHIFLHERAIYLLTFDASLPFNIAITGDLVNLEGKELNTISYNLDYWLTSIHNVVKIGRRNCVQIVGTHKDLLSQEEQSNVVQQVQEFLNCHFARHLVSTIDGKGKIFDVLLISNKERGENDAEGKLLRQKILGLLQQQSYWGELRPTKWILLEKALKQTAEGSLQLFPTQHQAEDPSQKQIVLPFNEVSRISDHLGINAEDLRNEVLPYLHTKGDLIYFNTENLNNNVVVGIKAFIDVIKV